MEYEGPYHAYNNTSLDPIGSQLNPVHILKSYFFKIYLIL
jgi:hypothetical protein